MCTITRSWPRRSRALRRSSSTGSARRRRSLARIPPLADVNVPYPHSIEPIAEGSARDPKPLLLSTGPEADVERVHASGRGHERDIDLHEVINVLSREPVRGGKNTVE